MTKEWFCKCIETMREYSVWERALYRCGFDLAPTPITGVLEVLELCMSDFEEDWAYDPKEGINWIVEWSFGESDNFYQHRHGREFDLTEAGALYDFLVFMNEHGWDESEE